MMRHRYSRVTVISDYVTDPGSRIHVIFEPHFDGRRMTLVESGREDIQDRINAYAPFCDLNYMLSRLKVGDMSVITTKQPLYGDFSGLPDNPVDAINVVRSAQDRFGALSKEEKARYNNDYLVWLTSAMLGSAASSSDNGDGAKVSVKEQIDEP